MRIIAIGILAIVFSAKAQDPKEIIRKYIDTVSNGNVENWKKITTVYQKALERIARITIWMLNLILM
jgi:hypothetical protein